MARSWDPAMQASSPPRTSLHRWFLRTSPAGWVSPQTQPRRLGPENQPAWRLNAPPPWLPPQPASQPRRHGAQRSEAGQLRRLFMESADSRQRIAAGAWGQRHGRPAPSFWCRVLSSPPPSSGKQQFLLLHADAAKFRDGTSSFWKFDCTGPQISLLSTCILDLVLDYI